ncbi:FHA domain-containing protein [Arthrobacter halodurans]|uniref:FHA domain-containing protein n=1 Tax=Arthrobacter halodurans TaxID=516699 RepID=A0ABV4UJG8_9MICC
MRLDIDIAFSVSDPGGPNREGTTINGTITAAGREIVVRADNADFFRVGPRAGMDAIREFAKTLNEHGVSVSLASPEGTIVSFGAVKASAAHRLVTRSAHIKPGQVSAWSSLLRGAKGGTTPSLVPPGTPFPLSPTFQRRYRMRPTTTHYTRGGGRPRLLFVRDSETWDGQPASVFDLKGETTVIGGAPEADLVLAGLLPAHASITHTDDDEYVLTAQGPVGGSPNLGAEPSYTLRTGARMAIGDWRLVYVREEYADHGRPYGGRQGGEFAYQRPQYDSRKGAVERDATYGVGDPRRH